MKRISSSEAVGASRAGVSPSFKTLPFVWEGARKGVDCWMTARPLRVCKRVLDFVLLIVRRTCPRSWETGILSKGKCSGAFLPLNGVVASWRPELAVSAPATFNTVYSRCLLCFSIINERANIALK